MTNTSAAGQEKQYDNTVPAIKLNTSIIGKFINAAKKASIAASQILGAKVIHFEKDVSELTDVNRRAERLMNVYGNQILRMAYSYVHCMDEAEDVLQETLIRVLEADPVFENETHEKAYLFKTASNIAKNHIIANNRRETDELSDELTAENRDDLSFVWDAVKNLPETQREAIHLFYQEGYHTSEIADILGRNESTIRSDLKRARERLKSILKEVYDFEPL